MSCRPSSPRGWARLISTITFFARMARLAELPTEVVGTRAPVSVMAVRTGISKHDPTALQTTLENHPAQARLALLTCSGDFNQGYRESDENTVVFARLVSVTH